MVRVHHSKNLYAQVRMTVPEAPTDRPCSPEYHNAVTVRGACKSYGSSTSSVHALCDVNLTVRTGGIYVLIGPSGCGKTTLLRCILGRVKADKGEIHALGSIPGSPGCGIPGSRVGYMPQEIGLYQEFTIAETLYFFGRLHMMSSTTIKKRMVALLELLELPETGRLIRQLSGGQQRRVSFATTLIHEPELLILDEPTVGVDPLLRETIWEYLLNIAHTQRKTVIITSHYIEEAQRADTVGFMRNGKMLAEAPPNKLLSYSQQNSLEKTFLLLCQDNKFRDAEDCETSIDTPFNNGKLLFHFEYGVNNAKDKKVLVEPKRRCLKGCSGGRRWLPSIAIVFALFIKNLNVMKRNTAFLVFSLALSPIQIILFGLCIGDEPKDLQMAVVNMEAPYYCTPFQLSCEFLKHLDPHILHQVNFRNRFEDAKESVRAGDSWGVIYIPKNFTSSLISRYQGPLLVTNETINDGSIHLFLDMTDQEIAFSIQMEVTQTFTAVTQGMLQSLHFNEHSAGFPVITEEPIYGKLKPLFRDFMAPGVLISSAFFAADALTALSFVLERKNGIMDRCVNAGVTTEEMVLGQVSANSLLASAQSALILISALFVFQISQGVSLWLVGVLTSLQGFAGLTLGLLISTTCKEETGAIQVATGIFLPSLLFCGIMWPIEAMPHWLRYVSNCTPMTYAVEAMRDIIGRGWGLTHMPVYRGILVTIGWGNLLMLLSAIILKIRRD